ncbi:MAG: hypothetical protein ACRYGF_09865 [Janthinobacterium lividum]
MSNLKGLASIAKGLSAELSPELVQEFAASAEPTLQPQVQSNKPAKPLAKTRDHDYKRVMVLVKRATEKTAYRKWEDAYPDKDFSDLVEDLLSRYAKGQIAV